MKTLISGMVVLALAVASPLCASTVIFQEDFDGNGGAAPAPGTALNTLGWTGADNMVISSATIDQGQSADWANGSTVWPAVTKNFSHTPGAGEIYTLTGTLYAPTTDGADSALRIRNSSKPENQTVGGEIAYGTLNFGVPNVENWFVVTPQPTAATDVKLVFQGTTADFYYKANGTSAWTFAGEKKDIGWSTAAYDQVQIGAHGGVAGGVDSILLTASAVPEPSTIMLLTSGLIGLLAYAWRKQR